MMLSEGPPMWIAKQVRRAGVDNKSYWTMAARLTKRYGITFEKNKYISV
ncbi:hypothetical protein ALT785_420017 [Alteromonas infernus]